MSYKTILCVISAGQGDNDLKQALTLCEANEAHLAVQVLGIAAPPPVGTYAATVSETWAVERQADIERLSQRVKEVNEIIARAQVSADVDSVFVERTVVDDVVGRRARYADLAVIGADLRNNEDMRGPVLNGLFFHAQIPAMIFPDDRPMALVASNIMIAWDCRLEASRAVHEARPLLAAAGNVHVVMIDPEAGERADGEEPGADLATYLARLGAKVTVERVTSSGRSVAETLQRRAQDMQADLVVMGAYGHSRLRERIFGGVTRSMIEEPAVPVFMAR